MGTAYHNNHHRYAAAARAGFAWYEPDPAYYVLRGWQAMRLVRDVRSAVPEAILREGGIRSSRTAGVS